MFNLRGGRAGVRSNRSLSGVDQGTLVAVDGNPKGERELTQMNGDPEAEAALLEVLEYMQTGVAKIVEENVALQAKVGNQADVEAASVVEVLKSIRDGVEASISDRRIVRESIEKF